jgi:homocysteine S-methyltransferase
MASYAKKFVQYGVRMVGGCCGTTPQHIKAIRAAVQGGGLPGTLGAERKRDSAKPQELKSVTSVQSVAFSPPAPLETKSRLGAKLKRGDFIKIVEMIPPLGHDFAEAVDKAKYLQAHNIDAINVPDAPRSSARMSAIALAMLLEKSTQIETLAHYTCRDKNLLGMQADLLGAFALGLRNLLLITGDPPQAADEVDVYEVDSIGLTNMVNRLNHGIDVGGKSIGKPTGFVIGVGTNPYAINNDEELNRFSYKVEAGAEFALTQPIFDVGVLERFLNRTQKSRIPVIAAILPLPNFKTAEFLNYEIPGSLIPEAILNRMRDAQSKSPEYASNEGITIAQEILERIQSMVQGVQIRGPFAQYETPLQVLTVMTKGVSP